MSVLDNVVRLRQIEQEQANKMTETFMQGLKLKQDYEQANMLAELEKRKQKISLASSGLQWDEQGNAVKTEEQSMLDQLGVDETRAKIDRNRAESAERRQATENMARLQAEYEAQQRGEGGGMLGEGGQLNYGNRADGTPKGTGYLGEQPMNDGRVMTEMSVGVDFDGQETQIPIIIPSTTQEELDYLAEGNEPTPEMIQKSVEFAKERISQGKSPFKEKEEQLKSEDPFAGIDWSTAPKQKVNRYVPTADGRIKVVEEDTPQFKAWEKAIQAQIVEKAKYKVKHEEGISKSAINRETVGGAMKNILDTYIKSYMQGGAGNKRNEWWGRIASSGWVGEGASEKYTATSEWSGTKAEAIMKMMPMLTQQGEKAGSVRIIQGVLDKLWKTYPELGDAPKNAKGMISRSLTNMYSFAKVMEKSGGMEQYLKKKGYSPEQVEDMSDAEFDVLRQQIAGDSLKYGAVSNQEEQRELDMYLTKYMSSVDKLIEGRDAGILKAGGGYDSYAEYVKGTNKKEPSNIAVEEFGDNVPEGMQTFTVDGVDYQVPPEDIEEFKKDMGI